MAAPLDPNELLASLLRTQAEIRALELDETLEDQSTKDSQGYHRRRQANEDEDSLRDAITPTSPASIPEGTPLIVSPTDGVIDVPWADYHRPAQEQGWTDFPCALGTDCGLVGGSCISWYDCGPNEWCENNVCIPKDPNRPCEENWECPSPISESQYYNCISGTCRLTCGGIEAPCPEGQVCDPTTFFCGDGCTSDQECVPNSANAAPDARVGSFCVNYECVTPCTQSILCDGVNDLSCPGDLVCRDKVMRSFSDPAAPLYECVDGCNSDTDCEPTEVTLADESVTSFANECVDDNCIRTCISNSDCIQYQDDEVLGGRGIYEACVEGICRDEGKSCRADEECGDGQYCSDEGKCLNGCLAVEDCLRDCAPDSSCVATCGPDPSCTCENYFTGEECGTTIASGWEDQCPRDPACLEACPREVNCAGDIARNWQCVDNSCAVVCNDKSDCGTDGRYICRPNEAWIEKGYAYTGQCDFVSTGGDGTPEKICVITEVCEDPDEEGNINCTQTEECSFVSPYVTGDFYGCDCGEVCDSTNRCVPGVCTSDAECESCSYCRNGFCEPGCNEDNPCREDECCGTDSKCRPICSKDSDCAFGEECGEGGCCADVCFLGTPCLTSSDCYDGEICFENYCEEGCDSDSDCGDDEVCDNNVCFESCIKDDDCRLDDGEVCTDKGYCKRPLGVCQYDEDCPLRQFSSGAFLTQVCDKYFDRRDPKYQDLTDDQGVCRPGCRNDDECPTSMLCLDGTKPGGGFCEYICNSSDQCESLGYGEVCVPDQKAKSRAGKYYDLVISKRGTSTQKKRWKALASDPQTGVCLTEASERDDGGKPVCAGYEDCTQDGCVRLPCNGDLDCPDGSCLSDGQCGQCRNDNDCQGTSVCDVNTGCDENGENCDPNPTGSCSTPCIPEKPCDQDSDCPTGNYCATERNQIGQIRRICQPGCRAIQTCSTTEDCITPEPSGSVCFEQACRFDFDCTPPESSGVRCLINSDCPGTEVCGDVEQYENIEGEIIEEGYCQSNADVKCIDDRCVNSSGGCPYGEVCVMHDDPSITDYDGTCEIPKPTCSGGICQNNGAGTCYPGEACRSGTCVQTCEIKTDGINAGVDPCGDGEQCIGSVCEYVGYSCVSDQDCPEGIGQCFNGKCREDLRCSVHADCDVDRQACVDGTCRDAARCNVNTDCARTCDDASDCSSRQSSDSECQSSVDCEGRETCVSGRCKWPAAQCVGGLCQGEDPDDTRFCGPKGICLTGEACSFDSECSFPDICVDNTCQFVVRCNSSNQCAYGTFCDGNRCVADNRCGQDTDCKEGFFCNASGRCQELEIFSGRGFGSGCDDTCVEFCGDDFRCHPYSCQSNADCPCGGFCYAGSCSSRCSNDTNCPAGQNCIDGSCLPKEPCLNDVDCPGQTSCDDEGFCDGFFSHCLVDSDCDVGVCVDAECVDCRSDQDCQDQFALDGQGCDDERGTCFNDQLICFNNTCETPCYTGLTDGNCTEGLQYGDFCTLCPDSCPGGSDECQLDGTTCGEQIVWDEDARREKYIQIECKTCVLPCSQDTDCKQGCKSSSDCEQYDPSGAPCDPNPGLACDPSEDDFEVCPFPEESRLECEIDGRLDSSYCANGYETCQRDPENPFQPGQCRFPTVTGGSARDNSCAMRVDDNSLDQCETDQQCLSDGEVCSGGECKLPPCSAGEYCFEGTCDFQWRVPTCKSNNRCLGTEADAGAYDPCPFGEICSDEFLCVWPEANCVGGSCEGIGLVQDNLCEYNSLKDGKYCEFYDGRCDSNSDCQRLTSLDGAPRYCQDYQCVVGELCFFNSDCEPGEVCEAADGESGPSRVCARGPGWNDGVAQCSGDSDCGEGFTCTDRACVFKCGPDVEAYTCRRPDASGDPGIDCPPGYNCNSDTNLCDRPGYDGIDRYMEECAKGVTCFNGGCVPAKGSADNGGDSSGGNDNDKDEPDYECRSPRDCNEPLCNAQKRTKWDCNKGQCVEVWLDEYPARPGEPICTDPDRVEDDGQTDICEAKGLCCSDQGFCEACYCDDENPCTGYGECCDRDSGLCVNIKTHPKTEYGAPFKCSFDKIFCEVLGPDGDDGNKNEIDVTQFQSKGYPGCQSIILADGSLKTTCWEGGPITPQQIATILGQECNPYEEKEECTCEEEPPAENECYTNQDCGEVFGKCVAKRFKSTPCCPISDENGNDYIDRNICQSEGKESKDPTCFTNADCTECETCEGAQVQGMDVRKGRCKANCSLCPCGGSLSDGESCPSCVERYGDRCIKEVQTETTPESIDPITGELIPARGGCDCAIKQESDCCETFYDRGSAGECGEPGSPTYTIECRFAAVANNRDGCAYREYKGSEGELVVGQVDYCADFDQGICARCTQDSHCPGEAVCVDYECATQCGGEGELPVAGNCSCCTQDMECKELYESWSESRDAGDRGQETRACGCTDSGINCSPWNGSDPCYQWVLEDEGSGDEALSERQRKQEQAMVLGKEGLPEANTRLDEAFIKRNDANAALFQAQAEKNAACEEPSEICKNAVDKWFETEEKVRRAEERIKEAEKEVQRVEERLENAEEAVEKAEERVGEVCPAGDTCESAIEGLDAANRDLLAIEEEILPDARAEVVYFEDLLQDLIVEEDYWIDAMKEACPDGYQPCVAGNCLEGSTSLECTAAQGKVESASNAVVTAGNELNDAILNLQNVEAQIRSLESQVEDTVYRPSKWVQRRTCSCCIDGECRPEDECTFGTCYLCPGEKGKAPDRLATGYKAQLYMKAGARGALQGDTPVPIKVGCMDDTGKSLNGHKDCPEIGFIHEVGGQSAIEFEYLDQCVKYRCENGITISEQFCSADFYTWFDYCLGSLWGGFGFFFGGSLCIFRDNSEKDIYWWNGYEYTMYCPLAGLWAYNEESDDPEYNFTFGITVPQGGGDWVQLLKVKDSSIAKSGCAYPNPLGHVGGNWLHPMSTVYSMHKYCGPVDILHGCADNSTDCYQNYELLLEAGDPTELIRRLEAQEEALQKYVDDLEAQDAELDQLATQRKNDKSELEGQKASLDTDIEQLESDIAQTESDIKSKQEDISDQEEVVSEKEEEFNEVDSDLASIRDEKNAAIEDRDEIQKEYDLIEELIEEAEKNKKSAKEEREKADRNVKLAEDQKRELKQEAEDKDCVCFWDEDTPDQGDCGEDEDGNPAPPNGSQTIECVDLLYAIEDIIRLIEEELKAKYDALVDEVNAWEEEIKALKEDQSSISEALSEAKQLVSSLEKEWAREAEKAQDAWQEYQEEVTKAKEMRDGLVSLNQQLENQQTQLETAQGNEGTKEEIEEKISNIDDILENIKESKFEIKAEVDESTEAIQEKNNEIERLKDEWGESKPEAASRPDKGDAFTKKELKEKYDEAVKEKEQKEKEKWYPDS